MLNVLHSFYKPFCLALLAVLGLACGHLIDTVLQKTLRPGSTTASTRAQPVTTKTLKMAQSELNLILQNNIFDTNDRSADATMAPKTATSQGQERPAKATGADLKLIGTVVAGDLSQVLLAVNKELKIYHLDDKLPDDGTIEEIRRNQVDIRNSDQSLTTLSLHEKPPFSRSNMTPESETKGSGEGAVREIGENRWMISRNTIDSVRENFADQLRLAQMQPRTVDGKTDGFLIQRINPRSLLVKVGLRRGDVIIDVNNIKLDSPEKALQVFQQLREARQITVAVERKGQPMSFAYEIE